MHLLFVVSDTLTGCNLCWTVSCPTWWYAELSEHRSNIQSTSACSCFYITDMNLLKFTHIIIHHTDPHTLNRNHVLSSDCDRWSGFPAPTRVYFKDLKTFVVFQGFIKLFDRKISWLWGLRVSCDSVFVCKICELTADRWRNVVAKVTLWALMSQIWGVSV